MMKPLYIIFMLFAFQTVFSQQKEAKIVEVACGQCQFKMKQKKGCDLAVRIDGKSYFIEGTKIDDHGDAHAKDGFCNAVRKAEAVGEIKGDKFVVSYFKLLPENSTGK